MASTKSTRKKSKYEKLKPYTSLAASIIFILLGAFLLVYASVKTLGITVFKPEISPTVEPTVKREATSTLEVSIPRINKVLKVEGGEVVNNRWSVSETGISYLTTSALPGTGGNTVMYGHNRINLLGELNKVGLGDIVSIKLDNGEVLGYRIFETRVIKPTEVDILNETEEDRLTLYTCSGFLDQARFVVFARLENRI